MIKVAYFFRFAGEYIKVGNYDGCCSPPSFIRPTLRKIGIRDCGCFLGRWDAVHPDVAAQGRVKAQLCRIVTGCVIAFRNIGVSGSLCLPFFSWMVTSMSWPSGVTLYTA
jgi:hypothetical protein